MKIYHIFSSENKPILKCSKNRSILHGRFYDKEDNDKEHETTSDTLSLKC